MILDTASPNDSNEYGDATPDDLIATIKQCAKEWRQARVEWLEEAKECYDFVAGHQWTDDELQILRDAKRPAVVFDRIEPVINVVAGLEVTNRQEVSYLPREVSDSGVGEIWTGAGRWVRDGCNAEDEESEAFRDMAICGEGWTETRLDYEYDQDGDIPIERVDPFEIIPDSSSQKKNYRDAEGLIREKMVSPLWAKETWPEKADELEAQEAGDGNSEFDGEAAHLNVRGDQYQSPGTKTGNRNAKKLVKLTEYQYKKRVPYYRVENPMGGEPIELTVEEFNQMQEAAKAAGAEIKSVRQSKCIRYRAFAIGDVLLENGECPDPNSFTYHAMTDKRDRRKRCWYGLVRKMRDPQRWSNKFFSQTMHILNTNAKGGVMYEKDAVENAEQFEATWADPGKPTILRAGALAAGKIKEKTPPPFPSELPKLLEFAIASIYQVSGVNPEMLGGVDRDQAAVLEYQRKQAGVTILATLFDALRKYRKEQGKNLLYLIRTYLSDDRLIRIVGKEGAQYVPLTKDSSASKYDVVIDESPNSPNQKEKTWMTLQGLLPLAAKGLIQLPPQIIEYIPLPQSLIDSMKKPDPEQQQKKQMQEQMQLAAAKAEIDKTNAEAKKAEAEAMAKLTDAGLKKAEIEGQATQMQHKLITDTMATKQKAELETWKAKNDAALEVWKAQQQIALERQKAEAAAALQQQTAQSDMALKKQAAEGDMAIAKDKLAGEQELKGIKDIRGDKALRENLQAKVDFLNEQIAGLRDDINTPDEIVRGADGRVSGKRKARKSKAA